MPKRAVVLVGGFGTRLRPLTLNAPKQMLPVCGVAMLERVVARLGEYGVEEAVLSLGYRPDAFQEAYADNRCGGVQLSYAIEPEPLDTAGAIAFAARAAGIDETFFAFNGDVLTDLDLNALAETHQRSGGEATIHLMPVDDPSRFGVVPTDDDGRVLEFVEKPPPGEAPSNWINAGSYVLEPSVLDRINPGERSSIEREVFPAIAAEGKLFAFQSDVYWLDAGTPEAYVQAHLDELDGRRGTPPTPGAGSTVDATAEVKRSYVGAGCTIAANASVTESVLMDGVTVEAGARIDRSIVAAGSTIGSGASVTDLTVVGFDQAVDSGASLADARVPPKETWE